jgi:hypothetical protein
MEKETKKEGHAAVPQHIAEASDAKKRAKRKTLAQLPVYRALANLKYLTVSMMIAAPRSTTKFFDQLLCTISEAKKAVGMADISRSAADRSWYIDCARGFCKSRRTYGRRKQFINSMGGAFWKYFTVGGHYQNIKIKSRHRYKTIAL